MRDRVKKERLERRKYRHRRRREKAQRELRKRRQRHEAEQAAVLEAFRKDALIAHAKAELEWMELEEEARVIEKQAFRARANLRKVALYCQGKGMDELRARCDLGVHLTMPGVVSFSSLRPFGPSRVDGVGRWLYHAVARVASMAYELYTPTPLARRRRDPTTPHAIEQRHSRATATLRAGPRPSTSARSAPRRLC